VQLLPNYGHSAVLSPQVTIATGVANGKTALKRYWRLAERCNLGALFRNGGGIVGDSGFLVRHGLGQSFLCVFGACRALSADIALERTPKAIELEDIEAHLAALEQAAGEFDRSPRR